LQNKMNTRFAMDVDAGLSQPQKRIPPKYFYDEKGSALFADIMRMPEYYLTDAELEIFTSQTHDLIDAFDLDRGEYFELIELGAGDGFKTRELLKDLVLEGYRYDYMPIDISKDALEQLQESLAEDLPQVSVVTKHGDYFHILESLKDSHHPKVVLFLGSNMGNMSDAFASDFIYRLGASLNRGDKLLIGVDLIKSADVVLPAYNDAGGITRAFNLNLLRRINRELGGDFNLNAFEHAPEYTEEEGVAHSYLKSLRDQDVTIAAMGKTYRFARGERVHTEISRKYNDEIMARILSKTDFEIIRKLTDSKGYFADYILNRR